MKGKAVSGNNPMYVYINGELIPQEKATVSVFDHGFVYGDGAFEGLRVDNWVIFRLDEHIDRLYRSAQYLKIQVPISKDEMKEAIAKTVRKSKLRDGYLRPIVTRGQGPLGVEASRNLSKPTIVIIPQIRKKFDDHIRLEVGVSAIIASTRRTPAQCVDPQVKSCNYINNILAKMEAWDASVDMAIMLGVDGFVSEGATENIFAVRNGILKTPMTISALDGITRREVIDMAHKNVIPFMETNLTAYELYAADEVFLTGTLTELLPVTQIDGRVIGSGKAGPITRLLETKLRGMIGREGYRVLDE